MKQTPLLMEESSPRECYPLLYISLRKGFDNTHTFNPSDTSICLFVLLLLLCHNQEDFMVYFDGVDILDREVNIKDVVLTIDEADGCLAPAKGCARGCFRYWCCCEGVTHLCCPHKSSEDTVEVKKCICC